MKSSIVRNVRMWWSAAATSMANSSTRTSGWPSLRCGRRLLGGTLTLRGKRSQGPEVREPAKTPAQAAAT